MSEWHLIEDNPPPHNVEVLLAWENWTDGCWVMEVDAYSTGKRYDSGHSSISHHGSATHWMPLPTPPKPATPQRSPSEPTEDQ